MMKKIITAIFIMLSSLLLASCSNSNEKSKDVPPAVTAAFISKFAGYTDVE